LEIDVTFHEAYWFMGVALDLKGELDAAAASLEKAIGFSGGSDAERGSLEIRAKSPVLFGMDVVSDWC
jgi:hypothetical protein